MHFIQKLNFNLDFKNSLLKKKTVEADVLAYNKSAWIS